MCQYLYIDRDTGVEYCELLDEPCDDVRITKCPLLFE